ncbi:MAG: hydrogenase maturation peptidase HycI [Candidatus Thermoplasmatota archaeon]|nr:hydrogenase maturation peptidase HycI [Candidatus Thermoplasmatota archaeon]
MAKFVLMGVGNDMRGDDAAGVEIARALAGTPDWDALDCGTVPEDFTGIVRREKPESIVLADAAEIGLAPGQIRRIPKEKMSVLCLTTHNLPLSVLIEYLEEIVGAGNVHLIGIQPKELRLGAPMSKEVENAAKNLVKILKENKWRNIPLL